MPRVYKIKTDARRERVTIPVTPEMFGRLRNHAVCRGQTCTALARDFLERGLAEAECRERNENVRVV